MSCTATPDHDELNFVLALHTRTKDGSECRGPLLMLGLPPDKVLDFHKIFSSPSASELLWEGFSPEGVQLMRFTLCGAHWLDLACLIWMRAQQADDFEIHVEADQLLRQVCRTASWDAKEIVNMFQWQRARLT